MLLCRKFRFRSDFSHSVSFKKMAKKTKECDFCAKTPAVPQHEGLNPALRQN